MFSDDQTHSSHNLWTMRIYYFLWLGGLGFFLPFFNLYCARQGLTGSQIGWIASIAALVALVFSPIWTSLASKSGKSRLILQLSLVFTAVFSIILGQQVIFLWILILNAVRSIAYASISPMSDSLALSITEATQSGFGSIRVWASVGWCPIVLIAGWLIHRYGFFSGFIGTSLTMVLAAISIQFVSSIPFRERPEKSRTSQPIIAMLKRLLQNRSAMGMALLIVASGLGNSGVQQFEILYMDKLGSSEFLIGVAGMIGAVVELPIMPWSDSLLRRKVTPRRLILLSMLMYAVLRLLVYFFPSVAMIIITRAIGGVAFSFITIASIRYMSNLMSAPERGTVLALYTVTLVNILNIIGTPITGIAYDLFGTQWLYLIAALGYLIGWLCLHFVKEPAKIFAGE